MNREFEHQDFPLTPLAGRNARATEDFLALTLADVWAGASVQAKGFGNAEKFFWTCVTCEPTARGLAEHFDQQDAQAAADRHNNRLHPRRAA